MKLLSSFKKELILASRSFYFYIEIGISIIVLIVLLFAIPEHSEIKQDEYIYLNMPDVAAEHMIEEMMSDDIDRKIEQKALEADGLAYTASLIETVERNVYLMESEEAVMAMAKATASIGGVVTLEDNSKIGYRYYLQGYESERLKNLLKVIHGIDAETLLERLDAQDVRAIQTDYQPLNERENAIPPLITFTGSLMGMFVMASYIFLDKKEGVIKAFAVTASSVSKYLLSKIFVLMLTSVVTGLIVVVPVMGFKINYALFVLLLLTSGFFASVLGLLLSSFYKDITKAFSLIFVLVILFMLPSIAYFIPSWDPTWIHVIPTYPMLQGFKEMMITNGDAAYVLLASAGFAAAGAVFFGITNVRFRKSLSV